MRKVDVLVQLGDRDKEVALLDGKVDALRFMNTCLVHDNKYLVKYVKRLSVFSAWLFICLFVFMGFIVLLVL